MLSSGVRLSTQLFADEPDLGLVGFAEYKAVIDLYEPISDSILKPDLVSWYK